MKYHFCTLFDSNYLTRGLAMYESLEVHCQNFHLYIFAFDSLSFKTLTRMNLKYATIISLESFENQKLLSVKSERSSAEYCWTCTPSIILYTLENFSLPSCTYLDADLYFFDDPAVLIDEMNGSSVLLTEHRYTPKYDQTFSSGIYCVQFMTFNNDQLGMNALKWWVDACIEWCFARAEDGKFGDQKYLDDWTQRFDGVHVLQNLGGGVAPWNIQQYTWNLRESRLQGVEKKTNKTFGLVFFHFHALKFLEKNKVELSVYELDKDDIEYIYKPYLKHINRLQEMLKDCYPSFRVKPQVKAGKGSYSLKSVIKRIAYDYKAVFRFARRKLFNKRHVYDMKRFEG